MSLESRVLLGFRETGPSLASPASTSSWSSSRRSCRRLLDESER